MQFVLLVLSIVGLQPALEQAAELDVPPGPACVLDAYEPNNERRKARSFDAVAEGRLCAGDVDWLAFDGQRGARYRVTLEGPAKGWLYPPRARKPRSIRGSRTVRARRTGRYKLRIEGPAGSRYRLRVEPIK